jgi:hypothetical protein
MGTLMAYIPAPRWKAFLLSMPFPFTIANLSLGIPLGPSHALGLLVMLLFTHLVRWLNYGLKLAIFPAILISAAVYMGLGITLNHLVPPTPLAFWLFLVLDFALGVLLLRLLRHREEPSYRSPLPVAVKTLAVTGVVSLLVVMKKLLGGFMTMFPMVGVVAAYEARYSLWAIARQISVVMVTMPPMMGVMWLMQNRLGTTIAVSLAGGWAAFLAVLLPLTLIQNRRLNARGSSAHPPSGAPARP